MSSDFESLSCDDENSQHGRDNHLPPHVHSTSGSFDSLDDLVADQDLRLLRRLPLVADSDALRQHLCDNDDVGDDSAAAYGYRQYGVTGVSDQPHTFPHPASHSLFRGFAFSRDHLSNAAPAAPQPNARQPTIVHRKGTDASGKPGTVKSADVADACAAPPDRTGGRRTDLCLSMEPQLKMNPELPPPLYSHAVAAEATAETAPPPPPPGACVLPRSASVGLNTKTLRHKAKHLDDNNDSSNSNSSCCCDQNYEVGVNGRHMSHPHMDAASRATTTAVAATVVVAREGAAGERGALRYRTAAGVNVDDVPPAQHQHGNNSGSVNFTLIAPLEHQQQQQQPPSQMWRATCPLDSGQITPTTSIGTLTASATTRRSFGGGEDSEAGTDNNNDDGRKTQSQQSPLRQPASASADPRDRGGNSSSAQEMDEASSRNENLPRPFSTTTDSMTTAEVAVLVHHAAEGARLTPHGGNVYQDADGFYRTGLLEASSETENDEQEGGQQEGGEGTMVKRGQQQQQLLLLPSQGRQQGEAAVKRGEGVESQTINRNEVEEVMAVSQSAASAVDMSSRSNATVAGSAGVRLIPPPTSPSCPTCRPASPSTVAAAASLASLREKLVAASAELHRVSALLPRMTAVHFLSLVITVLVPLNMVCLDVMAFAWIRRRVDARYRPATDGVARGTQLSSSQNDRHLQRSVCVVASPTEMQGRYLSMVSLSHGRRGCSDIFSTAAAATSSSSRDDRNSSTTSSGSNAAAADGVSSSTGRSDTHAVPILCAVVLWLMVPNGLLVRLLLLSRYGAQTASPAAVDTTTSAAAGESIGSPTMSLTPPCEVKRFAAVTSSLYARLRSRASQLVVMELYVHHTFLWVMVHAVLPTAVRASVWLDSWMPAKGHHGGSLTPPSSIKNANVRTPG